MGISRITQYILTCDKCEEYEVMNQGDFGIFTLQKVKQHLRKEGWTFGKKVACPKCVHEDEGGKNG